MLENSLLISLKVKHLSLLPTVCKKGTCHSVVAILIWIFSTIYGLQSTARGRSWKNLGLIPKYHPVCPKSLQKWHTHSLYNLMISCLGTHPRVINIHPKFVQEYLWQHYSLRSKYIWLTNKRKTQHSTTTSLQSTFPVCKLALVF